MNLLMKIFWDLNEHYNYLQITQNSVYLQKLLNVQTLFGLVWGGKNLS